MHAAPSAQRHKTTITKQSICGVEGVRSMSLPSPRWQHGPQKHKKHRPGNNRRGPKLGALVHSRSTQRVPRPPPIRAAITTCKGHRSNFTHTKLQRERSSYRLGLRERVWVCPIAEWKRKRVWAKCPRKQKRLWPVKEFNYSRFGCARQTHKLDCDSD